MERSNRSSRQAGEASAAALAEAAHFGAYFATERWQPGEGWCRLAGLLEPATLDAEVRRTGQALAGDQKVEPRVVASTLHLGLVARFTAPLLGAALVADGIPELSVGDVWWRARSSGPLQIATSPVPLLAATPANLAVVIERLTGPLCVAVGERYAVSPRVLWGNVAASLAAAARVAGGDGRAQRLLRGALGCGALRGTIDEDGTRRSCCLFYRAPGGGYCGDCVLLT